MNETYIKFNTKDDVEELTSLFKENQIAYEVEVVPYKTELSNDGTAPEHKYHIKLSKSNFEQVNHLMLELSQKYINQAPKDYHLFTFSKEDLLNIVALPEEWSKTEYLIALKLLQERRVTYNEKTLNQIRQELKSDNVKHDSLDNQGLLVVLGYTLAVLGGFLGIGIGWRLTTHKRNLADGTKEYVYSKDDRIHGKNILTIGIISTLLWSYFKIILKN